MELYGIMIIVGVVISLVIQGIYLWSKERKIRYVGFLGLFGLYSLLGGFAGRIIRSTGQGELGVLPGQAGVHYSGTVLVICLLAIPCTLLMRKILRLDPNALFAGKKVTLADPNRLEEVGMVMNSLALSILVQQICGRLGCFSRGCCYGKPYTGRFSMRFPRFGVDYSVYPTQLMEVIMTAFVLVLVIVLMIKGINIFGTAVSGYALVIFISEFFMDQQGVNLLFGINVIQCVGILLFVLGIGYHVGLNKKRK